MASTRADALRNRLRPWRNFFTNPRAGRSATAASSRVPAVAGTVLLLLACLAVLALVGVDLVDHKRQPLREGARSLAGLSADVSVERDALGVPRIRAANRDDAIRALGFVHAQERFFQMDLLRRTAAGERAALLGPSALDEDRRNRLHQFRRRASQVIQQLSPAERATLEAYAHGVNAGLASLPIRPIEYLLLRVPPAPWQPEDTVLAGDALFIALQSSTGDAEFARGVFQRRLNPEIYAYLFENGSRWSSTMDGSTPPIIEPSAAVLRAAALATPPIAEPGPPPSGLIAGSNAWAVSGHRTRSGRAMLANDLHLPLSMPGLIFRAELSYRDPRGLRRSIVGATIPGLPLVVVGSNGAVAWGLTNASIDATDLVELQVEPGHPNSYRTPAGWRRFDEATEQIAVRGGDPVTLKIRNTIWGPVVPDRALSQHPLVICWIAHDPRSLNLRLDELETAEDVAPVLQTAEKIRMPAMNLLLADIHGNIAWTIIGCLPARVGFDGSVPVSFADGTRCWAGALGQTAIPSLLNPPGGRIWSANNRSTERTDAIGDSDFNNGARAHQIAAGLAASSAFSEQDFLNLQHDDAAMFLQRWTRLLQATARTGRRIDRERRHEILQLLARWDGHASVGAAAYALVRDFRLKAISLMTARLLGQSGWPAGYSHDSFDFEEPVWLLVRGAAPPDQPGGFSGRENFLAEVLDQTLRDSDMSWGKRKPLAERTWGPRNVLRASHPLSAVLPLLRRWLDLPATPQAGDNYMPLVAGPKFGAALRLVVTPGAERRGLFQMPGGQGGDPFSSHYDDQFETWLTRHGSPLSPGASREELLLRPTPVD